jgi:hypothetical protein
MMNKRLAILLIILFSVSLIYFLRSHRRIDDKAANADEENVVRRFHEIFYAKKNQTWLATTNSKLTVVVNV